MVHPSVRFVLHPARESRVDRDLSLAVHILSVRMPQPNRAATAAAAFPTAHTTSRPSVVNKIAARAAAAGGDGVVGSNNGRGGTHPGFAALAVAVLCFVALNLLDDGARARGVGEAGIVASTSAFNVVANAASASRTQVINLRPDASLQDLSKPRRDAARVVDAEPTADADADADADDATSDSQGAAGKMPPPSVPQGDRERLSILARARPEDVRLDPYPHVVVRDALDPTTYAQLAGSYPAYKDVVRVAKGGGKTVAPNSRVDIRASMIGEASARAVLTPLWREFVSYHTSRAFYVEVLDLFEDAIRANHGYLEDAPAGAKRTLRELTTAVRLTAAAKPGKCDVAMDAQIGVNTPVTGEPRSVRGPHVDNVHELYAALLYMRDDGDGVEGAGERNAQPRLEP